MNFTKWRSWLLRIGMALGLIIFLLQLWKGFSELQQQDLQSFRWPYLILSLSLTILFYAIQLFAWLLVMRYLGASITLAGAFRGYWLSFVPRYIPGTVWGYWSRSQWLLEVYSVPYSVSLLGSILETLALILTAMVVLLVKYTLRWQSSLMVGAHITSIILLSVLWFIAPHLVKWILQYLRKDLVFNKLKKSYLWGSAWCLYILLWLIYGGTVLSTLNVVHPEPLKHFDVVLFVAIFSWVVGSLIVIVPAGLGVRELTMANLLATELAISIGEASLVGVVLRTTLIVAEAFYLLLGLGGKSPRRVMKSAKRASK